MTDPTPTFEQLGLNANLLKALKAVGYEQPSPIQAEAIPPMLEGRDILGQAQTGTGKTAAFALPILNNINLRSKVPQVLVLAPTRELAIQVAEAFQTYAHHLSGFNVLPIYGGQGYDSQIRALKRGVQVIVGTPGRVMDHMRKGTLKLDQLTHLVLDEADEMLRMGFIDDVEWVLTQIPEKRQIALFSATMPREIAKVANTYLNDPAHIKIKVSTATAAKIRQRYWPVAGLHKLDALTRILEVENFDAMIIFVRTKTATLELAEKLQARGYRCAALNGDISQNVRERTVDRLKKGHTDILIATDVAARGLDVDRISHVLNYDIPYDTEAYVHRIGRTGRAGREGEAILFVAKREMRMLRSIEKATGKTIETMGLPSVSDINQQRVARFKQTLTEVIEKADTTLFREVITAYQQETDTSMLDIAAAFAKMSERDRPLFIEDKPSYKSNAEFAPREKREGRNEGRRDDSKKRDGNRDNKRENNVPMDTYRIEVGHNDKVTPSNIVGAIANEADIESQYIGHIRIKDDHSTIDLPSGMPAETFESLKNVWVCQKKLNISLFQTGSGGTQPPKEKKRAKKKVHKKKPSAKSKAKPARKSV